MDNVIELKNVNKIFGEKIKTQVLFDIDLKIKKGEFLSIIGQSGSGKSTLLNLIGTLDKATDGEVFIKSRNVNSLDKNQMATLRNKTIGFIFQFHYLLSEFTSIENVMMPYEISDKKNNLDARKRATELLDMVGLSDKINTNITLLSGGQQQRVAIARALMNEPDIVLADEPTGNLDSKTTHSIYELLREINKKKKTTFLIITHDQKVAENMDRIVQIEDGRIVLDIDKKKE